MAERELDLSALGRAQTRGEDIRPQRREPEPVEEPAGRSITVGEFLAAADEFNEEFMAGLRRALEEPR